MAVQADYISVVQQLYVSYFGRPADYYGLDNFTKQLAAIDTAGTLTDFKALTAAANSQPATSALGKLINSFNGSPEAAALYGTDTTIVGTSKFVAAVYKNVLGREADVEGLTYWVNAIQSGALTRANVAAAITEGAISNTSAQGLLDAKAVANKNAVAVNFTTAINTTAEINGYSGDAAAAAARAMLQTVNDTTVPAAFQATVESTLSTIVTGANAGVTTVLAKGLDNLTGTTGDDTFVGAIDAVNAELNTLSSLDAINGGAGVDTLKIAHGGNTAVTNVGNLTSVEVISVDSSSTAGVTIDTTTATGVTNLNIVRSAAQTTATAAATTDVGVTLKLAGNVTVNGGKNVTATITDSLTGSGAIDIGAAGADVAGAVVVKSTGVAASNATVAASLATIAVGGGTSINVTQSAGSAAALVAGGAAVTHTQGAITIDASSATTEVTVKQDAAVTAASTAGVTAVTEVTNVKFTALAAAGTVTVGGLTFTASKALTAAEVAAAFSKLLSTALKPTDAAAVPVTATGDTQGTSAHTNGTFSGSFVAGWNSATNVGDTVTFTGSAAAARTDLAATNATATLVTDGVNAVTAKNTLGVVAGKVDITGGAAVKTVTVNGYSATTSNFNGTGTALATLNLSNGGDFAVSDTADTLALNLEKVGSATTDAALVFTAAPITLNAKSVGNNYVTLNSGATKTLNVTGTGVLEVGTVGLGGLETVKVSETAGLTLDATPAATITSVDTTATTGAVTVSIDGTKAVYTGGAGVDTVSLVTATGVTKAIDLGAGDDTLVFTAAVTGSTATMSGGAGTDTLSMDTARADALDATKQTFYTNFERLLINDAAGSATVDLENLNFTNYVTTNGSAGTLTLSNLANNGTVVIAGDNVTGTTVNIKDATTGAADVLNLGLSKAGILAAGLVTADKVETIKINGTDLDAGGAVHTATLKGDTVTSVTVSGDAGLNLSLHATTDKLVTINGSTMTGKLIVTANGANAMTITGGAGADVLTASQGATSKADVLIGGAGNDTLVAGDNGAKLTGGDGNDIFLLTSTGVAAGNKEANTYSVIEDFKAGDLLQLQYWDVVPGTPVTADVTAFAKLTAALNPETAVFANFVDAAMLQAGAGEAVWFMFGGSSYVVVDSATTGATFVNGEDLIIKLTGVDLTTASWNSTFATVSL